MMRSTRKKKRDRDFEDAQLGILLDDRDAGSSPHRGKWNDEPDPDPDRNPELITPGAAPREIGLHRIYVPDDDYYRAFPGQIDKLAELIGQYGLREPITIYRDPEDNLFRIRDGLARFLAIAKLGQDTISACVVGGSRISALSYQLISEKSPSKPSEWRRARRIAELVEQLKSRSPNGAGGVQRQAAFAITVDESAVSWALRMVAAIEASSIAPSDPRLYHLSRKDLRDIIACMPQDFERRLAAMVAAKTMTPAEQHAARAERCAPHVSFHREADQLVISIAIDPVRAEGVAQYQKYVTTVLIEELKRAISSVE